MIRIQRTEDEACAAVTWGADAPQAVLSALNPSPLDLELGRKLMTWASIPSFVRYLSSRGIGVQIEGDASTKVAHMERWARQIAVENAEVSEAEFMRRLKVLGIDYRDAQVSALWNMQRFHFNILAALCGTGKTLCVLSHCRLLKDHHGRVLMVVVAPKGCFEEYIKENFRFGSRLNLRLENLVHGSDEDRRHRIATSTADILLINTESLHKFAPDIRARLQDFDGATELVTDEAHTIKNCASRRHAAVNSIACYFSRLTISTATPTPLGPSDMRAYLQTVHVPEPITSYSQGIPERDFSLVNRISYVSTEDDLPYAPVSSERIEYSDNVEHVELLANVVHEAVDNGGKVVVFCATNAAMQVAFHLFPGVPRTVLSGSYFVDVCGAEVLVPGNSMEARERAIHDFNYNPNCKVLIANYKVGSTGLNLQFSGARTVVFFEIPTSGADFFQAHYRVRRPNVGMEDGFRYVFAIPTDPRLRRRALRQFLKLENQRRLLSRVHSSTSEGHRRVARLYRGVG